MRDAGIAEPHLGLRIEAPIATAGRQVVDHRIKGGEATVRVYPQNL
jgi:hypothetical protein